MATIANKKCKTHIGSKIQKLIELHDLSLSKIASATGLTSETIRQIINGTIKNPGIETLSKIAEGFSISLFDLLETNEISKQINKKRIKILDLFDLQKINYKKDIEDLVAQSIESKEILYIDEEILNYSIFGIEINENLAEKITNCGMPMIKKGDILVFTTNSNFLIHSIVLVKCKQNILSLGIIMEIEENYIWIKSVDMPQKQIISRIKKEHVIGIVHNVQFKK